MPGDSTVSGERLEVDLDLGVVRRGGRPLALSVQEVAVLSVLGAAGGRVVGRSELQRRAGLTNRAPRRCDAVIVGLRRALGPESIATVRGRGWRCLVDVATSDSPASVPA
ncbi:MAG: winged helix-turn-helix domain-containing protein [Acidimicrobiales bacterium]